MCERSRDEDRRGPVSSLAEDAGPEVHELRLVEAAVLVLVEHLDQRQCSLMVVAMTTR